jgi:hypothetical protein
MRLVQGETKNPSAVGGVVGVVLRQC